MKWRNLAISASKSSTLFISLLVLTVIVAIHERKVEAAVGTPCLSEPTDMTISFGDAITCAIDIEGDTDLFRFNGVDGDVIIVQVAWTSGSMRPCIELIAPDNSRIEQCANAFTNRIDTPLGQTGTYTVLVDVLFGGTGDYTLALERLIEPSPNAQAIQYGDVLEGQIDPEGELDLFFFEATAGETILIQVAWQSGSMRPCIELIAPDNSRTEQCANAFTNRIDTTLSQTGTYTILAEVLFGGTGNYAVALERLLPPSPNASILQYGEVIEGEINPVGDLDLYKFDGTMDDNILLTITWRSGSMRPCLQLIYPDNARRIACENAFSNQLDLTLDQTGTYTILADVLFGGTGDYTIELQCITGECLPTLDKFVYLSRLISEQ